jgi:hypothetical protein
MRLVSGTGRPTEPALAATDRIRTYRQQLADDEARQRQVLAQQTAPTPTPEQARPSPTEVAPPDPLKDERRRREYQSLFADSIALSRRPPEQQPNARAASSRVTSPPAPPNVAAGQPGTPSGLLVTATSAAPAGKGAPSVVTSAEPSGPRDDDAKRDEHPAEGPPLRLLEGTLIEAVLANRLDAALAGPVDALVTGPVYSHDRQAVLIPAGARVLGAATPVQSWGESRLAVSFHRLIMPDGHTYNLADACRIATQRIKIVDDEIEPSVVADAEAALQKADSVYIIGFGFDERNIKKLNLPNCLTGNRPILATAFGLTPIEQSPITRCFGGHQINLYPEDALTFVRSRAETLFD